MSLPPANESNNNILRIAVASDLHAFENNASNGTPSHLRITNAANAEQNPIFALKKLISSNKLRADLFLCPGDMGNRAEAAGIQYAWKAIHELGSLMEASLITAATGNHDLDSRYISTREADAKDILLGLDPPYPLPETDFNDKYWSRNYVIKESEKYRLVILNTSAHHGGRPNEIDYGRISTQTLSSLKNDLGSSFKLINILLCHHHPQQHQEIELGDYDVMKNGQLLIDLLDEQGNWLIIHGHKHHPKITYSSGSSTSPVIFSAGSFSAVLYPELQTRARNQFYLITLPFDDIERLGLVGTFKAWDWASGEGWAEAAGPTSGLSANGAFGYRSPQLLVEKIQKEVAQTKLLNWNKLCEEVPEAKYLLLKDIKYLQNELERRYYMNIRVVNGIPEEIGTTHI